VLSPLLRRYPYVSKLVLEEPRIIVPKGFILGIILLAIAFILYFTPITQVVPFELVIGGDIKFGMKGLSPAYFVSLISICASLYAISIILTAYLPTPWGVGHLRLGIIIPAIFALLGGLQHTLYL
jgi:hypothetical protein